MSVVVDMEMALRSASAPIQRIMDLRWRYINSSAPVDMKNFVGKLSRELEALRLSPRPERVPLIGVYLRFKVSAGVRSDVWPSVTMGARTHVRPADRPAGCPARRSSTAPVSSAAPKKKSFDRGGPVWPPRSNAPAKIFPKIDKSKKKI